MELSTAHKDKAHFWKEAVGRLKPGYKLMTRTIDLYNGADDRQWEGESLTDSMDETVSLWICKGYRTVKEVPGKSPKDVYLWLLRNDWLIEEDTLVPELKDMV